MSTWRARSLLASLVDLSGRGRQGGTPAAHLGRPRRPLLQKPSGGVRGIATGDTFRRLVARTLARGYARRFDEATRPYQFALQARAGTDCLAALLRAATELDPAATVVSLDGRCAYDSVSRAAFLDKLAEVTPSLVPFVRYPPGTGHRRTADEERPRKEPETEGQEHEGFAG